MNTKTLERIYGQLLLLVLAGIVIHAPLTVWLSSFAPDYEALFRAWKEIVMLLAISAALLLITKKQLWSEIFHDWLFRLIMLYGAGLHIVLLFLYWNGAAASAAGMAINLRYLLYFGLVYVLLRAAPRYKNIFLKVALAGGLVVSIFAVLQVTVLPKDILTTIGYSEQTIQPYLTVDNDPEYVRINSTMRGPNPLGAYMVILLALVLAYTVKHWKQMTTMARVLTYVLSICGLVAIWASYSRSALIALVASVPIIVGAATAKMLSRRSWTVIGVVIALVAGLLVLTRGTEFTSQVLLHENPDGGSMVSSNDQHILSLAVGVQRMAHQPFGAGIGSTGSASLYTESPLIIENQYLFVAHETGWAGLGLFLAIFFVVLSRLWDRRGDWLALGLFASGIGLAFIGILLPVWVDDTVSIVWWGLAAVALAGRRHDNKF